MKDLNSYENSHMHTNRHSSPVNERKSRSSGAGNQFEALTHLSLGTETIGFLPSVHNLIILFIMKKVQPAGLHFSPLPKSISQAFFAARIFAHLALAAAEIAARPAALILFGPRLPGFTAGVVLPALYFAQRIFCAARILALCAGLMVRLPGLAGTVGSGASTSAGVFPPARAASSVSNASIFSLRSAAWRSCDGVRFVMFMQGLKHWSDLRESLN